MKQILIIEDNLINLELINNILENAGYILMSATDAEKGIQLAAKHQPDLIILDIQLPGMDGLTATKKLRAIPETALIPILALTAYAMTGDKEKILAIGCSAYMSKPIRYKKLLKQVDELLK